MLHVLGFASGFVLGVIGLVLLLFALMNVVADMPEWDSADIYRGLLALALLFAGVYVMYIATHITPAQRAEWIAECQAAYPEKPDAWCSFRANNPRFIEVR